MKPEPVPSRTVAIVLAAGLGTRMKSRLPKVLHELCGRPMLGYVIDAAATATGAPPARRLLAADRGDPRGLRRTAPTSRSRPSRAGPPTRSLAGARRRPPDDAAELVVVYGDVPLLEADLLEALLDASTGRRRRPSSLVSVVDDRARPASAGSSATTTAPSSGSSRPGTRPRTSSRSTRSTPASTPSTRPGCADGSATCSPSPATGELYLTELVALARADGRAVATVEVGDDGTLLGINDRAAAGRGDLPAARADQRAPPPGRRDDARPVDRLRRRRGRSWRTDVTLEPNVDPARSDVDRGGDPIGAGSQLVDTVVGRDCRIWASVLECVRGRGRRSRSARSPTSGRARRSAAAPSSATTPRSRTAGSRPASSSTT